MRPGVLSAQDTIIAIVAVPCDAAAALLRSLWTSLQSQPVQVPGTPGWVLHPVLGHVAGGAPSLADDLRSEWGEEGGGAASAPTQTTPALSQDRLSEVVRGASNFVHAPCVCAVGQCAMWVARCAILVAHLLCFFFVVHCLPAVPQSIPLSPAEAPLARLGAATMVAAAVHSAGLSARLSHGHLRVHVPPMPSPTPGEEHGCDKGEDARAALDAFQARLVQVASLTAPSPHALVASLLTRRDVDTPHAVSRALHLIEALELGLGQGALATAVASYDAAAVTASAAQRAASLATVCEEHVAPPSFPAAMPLVVDAVALSVVADSGASSAAVDAAAGVEQARPLEQGHASGPASPHATPLQSAAPATLTSAPSLPPIDAACPSAAGTTGTASTTLGGGDASRPPAPGNDGHDDGDWATKLAIVAAVSACAVVALSWLYIRLRRRV